MCECVSAVCSVDKGPIQSITGGNSSDTVMADAASRISHAAEDVRRVRKSRLQMRGSVKSLDSSSLLKG